MIVQCEKCEKKYKIDPAKISDKGSKITCPNCGNIIVVRKQSEEEQENFVPCSLCGSPATIGLDTDTPICERCKEIEEQKVARFVAMPEDDRVGSPMDRELDLKSSADVSFDSLSGGDYSHDAYSTDILPGKGKDYLSPDEIIPTGKVKEEDNISFDQLAAPMSETHADFISGSASPQTRPEKISDQTPAPAQAKPPRPEPPTPPPQKKPVPQPPRPESTPAPKPTPQPPPPRPEPTPAPKPAPKQPAPPPMPPPKKEPPPAPKPPPKPAPKEPAKKPIDMSPVSDSEGSSLVSDIATFIEPNKGSQPDKPVKKSPRESAAGGKDKIPIKETGPQVIHQDSSKKTSPVPLILAAALIVILLIYVLIQFHPWRP